MSSQKIAFDNAGRAIVKGDEVGFGYEMVVAVGLSYNDLGSMFAVGCFCFNDIDSLLQSLCE